MRLGFTLLTFETRIGESSRSRWSRASLPGAGRPIGGLCSEERSHQWALEAEA